MRGLVSAILLAPVFQRDQDFARSRLLYRAVDSVHDPVDRALPNQRVLGCLDRTATSVDQFLEVRPDLRAVNSRSVVLLVHLLPFNPMVVRTELPVVLFGPGERTLALDRLPALERTGVFVAFVCRRFLAADLDVFVQEVVLV